MLTIDPGHVDFIRSESGSLLREDVIAWGEWYGSHGFFKDHPLTSDKNDSDYIIKLFDKLFVIFAEFRSLSDYRISAKSPLYRYKVDVLRRANELHIQCNSIGPRFRIQHGQNTYVLARSIGSDFWVNHNVTIGSNGGTPTIGNRVVIRTGAVVVGPIFIGNDCLITANSVVSENMPSGHAAYAPRTMIIPRRFR